MLTRNLFKKRHLPFRVHIDEANSAVEFANQLFDHLPKLANQDIVIVCIGTDRSTGDALGPLVGSKLIDHNLNSFYVYGTLEEPIHAVNLEEKLTEMNIKHHNPFIIGIDACLGRSTSIGYISIHDGPVKPGAAVKKKLPPVGDIHITGVVNVGGFMEYMVLQNTRLHLVIKIADKIAESIIFTDKQLQKENRKSFLENIKPSFFSN